MGLARGVTALVVAAALVVTSAGPAGVAAGSEPAPPDGPVAGSVADSSVAADAVSAAEIARVYGHAVVVESQTTQTSQVQALADGTMQLTESSLPVRVLGDSGWEPVDLTLIVDGGVVRPRVSPMEGLPPVRLTPCL